MRVSVGAQASGHMKRKLATGSGAFVATDVALVAQSEAEPLARWEVIRGCAEHENHTLKYGLENQAASIPPPPGLGEAIWCDRCAMYLSGMEQWQHHVIGTKHLHKGNNLNFVETNMVLPYGT